MGNILLLFLVLFPMLLSAWVFPLRRRDRRYRNWLIRIIPAVELAAALLLLLWPGAALELPGVFGFGLRLQAGSLGSLLALVSAFLWAATGLNCPSYFAAAEGFIFPGGKEPPAVITYLGKVLPCAVIGLLVVFCLKDVTESTHYGLPEMIAILFIVVLHKWKKSTLLSIGGGTVFYMVLVQTIFG